MNMNLINEVTAKQLKKDLPVFSYGDTVKVHVRIVEGDKERIQVFQGVVISRRGSGISESFTVRKLSNNVGVERVFQIHSPLVAKIEVLKRGSVRRAKLYYLRGRAGKSARIAENRKLQAENLAAIAAEEAKIKAEKEAAAKAEAEAKAKAEAEAKAAAEAAAKAEVEAKAAAEKAAAEEAAKAAAAQPAPEAAPAAEEKKAE